MNNISPYSRAEKIYFSELFCHKNRRPPLNHPRHPRFISARTAIGIFTAALLLCSCSLTGRSASLSSSTEPSAGAITVLTIGTADSGGSMYPAGEAIAEAIETPPTISMLIYAPPTAPTPTSRC